MAAVPVTVVGGYLGAGKTTLVNHVLRTASERIAVIVNDFGEISIDEELIIAKESDKLTLANGCICCSLAEGFASALTKVRASAPQRLLIEASGVSDPAQVAAYAHTPGLRLDAVVVIADAETVQARSNDRWVADTVRRQLTAADLLILNKMDLASTAVEELRDWLRPLAPRAAVVCVTNAEVPLNVLFDTALNQLADATPASPTPASPAAEAAANLAEDVFESFTVKLHKPLPKERIEALLADLPENVLRLKGLVQLSQPNPGPGEPNVDDYVVQSVGKRSTITPSEPHSQHVLSLVARRNSGARRWLLSQLES